MKIFYCDHFVLPLPDGHRFPMSKYSRLRQAVVAADVVVPDDLCVPDPVEEEEILRVHDADYWHRVQTGELSKREVRRIGFPWSPEMVERSRRSVGGTLAAARAALDDGVAVNLAGGTHHAFRDHGQGFCVLNDAAITLRALQAEGHIERAVVVDCDVHQGDGTASIFADDASVFTLSLHGRRNFPFEKEKSDLDIELEDGTEDGAYLTALQRGLERALEAAGAQIAIYLAGADPYANDRLGRLALSKAGLRRRDEMVLEACRDAGLAVAVAMAGGYAPRVEDVVDIHLATVQTAAAMAKR